MRPRAVFYSPATIVGGAEKYLCWVVPEVARTWDVTLFCPATRELDTWVSDLRCRGVRVVRLGQGRRVRRLLDLACLARTLRSSDLLHLNLIKPPISPLIGVLGWLAGVPLRTGTQHLVLAPGQLSHYRIKQAFLYMVAGLHRFTLHWVISPSHYSTGVLVSRFGFPASRVHMIHYGIDLDYARCNAEPKPRPGPDEVQACWPVLGCVGWVQERKGQHLIVEALPALCRLFPHIHLLVVGSGPDIASLTGRARTLGVAGHLDFLGHRDDVDVLFRQMDVFVLPSRVESLGIAVIEAMAHRLPVIANDIPPLREVLGDTGIFLRTRSPEAIVEAVTQLFAMEDPQALGRAARARAETEFRLQRMVAETLCLFAQRKSRRSRRVRLPLEGGQCES